MKIAALLSLVLVTLACACTGAPGSFAFDGERSYQTATVCTNVPDLEPVIAYAEVRWHDANARVNMSVRVVDVDLAKEDAPAGCDAAVYIHDLPGTQLGWTESGVMALDPRVLTHADEDDIVAHELGHMLLGDAYTDTGHGPEHSGDEESIMFWVTRPGTQAITADDAGRLP